MKIGIVTFARTCNYGATLQCYALNKALSLVGGDPVTVDYWPQYFRSRYYVDELPFAGFQKDKFKEWRHQMKVKLIKDKRGRRFERFLEKNVKLTRPRVRSVEEFNKFACSSNIQKWITGSDQVWNDVCACFDPVYFLDVKLPEGSQKYSYAASFGMSAIPAAKRDAYKSRLTGYTRYSVREESGVDMIRGLMDVDVNVHCDPTLLLTADEWSRVAARKRKEPYILIYHVMNPAYLLQKARVLSESTGLKVVLVTPYFDYPAVAKGTMRKQGYEQAMASSPADFVSLFKNAEYVLTNSFHGTVFSAIFHKKFWIQTHQINGKINNRAINLLNILGIKGRELTKDNALNDGEIDWAVADAAIAKMRASALSYLKAVVSDPLT